MITAENLEELSDRFPTVSLYYHIYKIVMFQNKHI